MPAVYLANVGANAAHPFASPLFDDGTFELLPIVETPPAPGPHSVRFLDLRSWYRPEEGLRRWLPERVLGLSAHADPEFATFTYGDNCERAPRAAGLRSVRPGDLLFFLARLVRAARGEAQSCVPGRRPPPQLSSGPRRGLEPSGPEIGTQPSGPFIHRAGFYLAGFLEIESILPNVTRRPSRAAFSRFGANAHVRRGLNDPRHWDGFWVFAGSDRSRRFHRAVPVDRAFAEAVLRDAEGRPFRWDLQRTGLQVIGSYTRSCRRIIQASPGAPGDASARAEALRAAVEAANPGVIAGLL